MQFRALLDVKVADALHSRFSLPDIDVGEVAPEPRCRNDRRPHIAASGVEVDRLADVTGYGAFAGRVEADDQSDGDLQWLQRGCDGERYVSAKGMPDQDDWPGPLRLAVALGNLLCEARGIGQ